MRNKNRRRAGFIYVVGWRVISTRERKPAIFGKCPECGVDEARLIGRVRRAWFTMFFIPILPLDSAERAQRISQCRECRQIFEMPIEQLARRVGAGGRSFSDTIAVYNELREQPGNGKLLLKLLEMYEELGELSEAEAAGRHYPIAMNSEPGCAFILERMRDSSENAR